MPINLDAAKLFKLLDHNNDGKISDGEQQSYKTQTWYKGLDDNVKALVDRAVQTAKKFDGVTDETQNESEVPYSSPTYTYGGDDIDLAELTSALTAGHSQTSVSGNSTILALSANDLAALQLVLSKITPPPAQLMVGDNLKANPTNPNIAAIQLELNKMPADTAAAAIMILLGNLGYKMPLTAQTVGDATIMLNAALTGNPKLLDDLPPAAKAQLLNNVISLSGPGVIDLTALKADSRFYTAPALTAASVLKAGSLTANDTNPHRALIAEFLNAKPPKLELAEIFIKLGNNPETAGLIKKDMKPEDFTKLKAGIEAQLAKDPKFLNDLTAGAKALIFSNNSVNLAGLEALPDLKPKAEVYTAQSVLTVGTLTANATNPHRQRIADYLNQNPQQVHLAQILIKLGNDPDTAGLNLSNMSPADFAKLKSTIEAKLAKDPKYLDDLADGAKAFLFQNGSVNLSVLESHPDFMAKPQGPITAGGIEIKPGDPYYDLIRDLKVYDNENAAGFVALYSKLMGGAPMTEANLKTFALKLNDNPAMLAALPKELKTALLNENGKVEMKSVVEITTQIQSIKTQIETMKSIIDGAKLASEQAKLKGMMDYLRKLMEAIGRF